MLILIIASVMLDYVPKSASCADIRVTYSNK